MINITMINLKNSGKQSQAMMNKNKQRQAVLSNGQQEETKNDKQW